MTTWTSSPTPSVSSQGGGQGWGDEALADGWTSPCSTLGLWADLSLIEKRLKQGDYYRSREMLQADMLRMCKNCKTYNKPSTPYYA